MKSVVMLALFMVLAFMQPESEPEPILALKTFFLEATVVMDTKVVTEAGVMKVTKVLEAMEATDITTIIVMDMVMAITIITIKYEKSAQFLLKTITV